VTFAAAQDSSDWRRSSVRRRVTAIGLTLAAELLFLIILLGLSPSWPVKTESQPTAVTFDIASEPAKTRKAVPKPKTKAQQARPTKAITQPKPPPLPPSPLIALNKADMAAADISNLGSRAPGAAAASANVAGPGEGPGGAHLYDAEWYREPTDAELDYYLPKAVDRGSWALIGCKTVEHYHVENCYMLGESPLGSGLARAMRLASWQFLVRPPRIDGKQLIGSWVRIRIDFRDDPDK
jgi:hypothetical protein